MISRKWHAAATIALAVVLVGVLAYALYSANRKTNLTFASGQPSGKYQPMAESIAALVEVHNGRIHLDVVPSDGSLDNATRLVEGTADLALVQNDSEAGDGVRSLVPLHLGALHFLARTDSGITSLSDLEGHRVGVGLPSSGSHQLVHALLHHFELDLEKIDLVPLGIDGACRGIESGDLDALLIVLSLRSPAIDRVVSSGKCHFVGIGRQAAAGSVIDGFRLGYPFAEPYLIPRYAYAAPHGGTPGTPEEPIPTLAVRTVLVASADVPRRTARAVTRTVIENRNSLTRDQDDASLYDAPLEVAKLQFPLHPGAADYYDRNEPGFLVRYAEVIGLLVTLLITTYGLIAAAQNWFERRQKDRIDAYYLTLNRILNRLLQPVPEDELTALECELREIRSTALHLLARERLLPDQSFRIFQTLLAEAWSQIRHRRSSLPQSGQSTSDSQKTRMSGKGTASSRPKAS